ncbi:MAG: KilA-N domain-containing protein [Saprospiraceae bacterium]|nr:KilA-N domain-containing protein [Saprospiraceae bacterium]
MSKIIVDGTEISILKHGDTDYFSLTDIVKNFENSNILIGNWIRKKDTLEYLGIWERIHNANFKLIEFDEFKESAGTNRFTMSPQQWISKTNAVGIISKSGRYGGTYAHKDIAMHFTMWLSPEFQLLIIKEFQRLKENEAKLINPEWDYRRFLSKVNYRIHTDAIKDTVIPKHHHLTKEEEGYIYANEAEMLNMAVFATTSKKWKIENPELVLQGLNIRESATIPQLTVLANIENYNAILIKEGVAPKQRLEKLKTQAIDQLKSLANYKYTYPIDSPRLIEYQQNSTFDDSLKGLLNTPPPQKDKQN